MPEPKAKQIVNYIPNNQHHDSSGKTPNELEALEQN